MNSWSHIGSCRSNPCIATRPYNLNIIYMYAPRLVHIISYNTYIVYNPMCIYKGCRHTFILYIYIYTHMQIGIFSASSAAINRLRHRRRWSCIEYSYQAMPPVIVVPGRRSRTLISPEGAISGPGLLWPLIISWCCGALPPPTVAPSALHRPPNPPLVLHPNHFEAASS